MKTIARHVPIGQVGHVSISHVSIGRELIGGISIALVLTVMGAVCLPVSAAAEDSFFAGREIRLIVGTGTGGGYDTYARLVARYLGQHIPGNPSFVVSSMPGASGVKAATYLYSTAPRDGSVMATFNNAVPVYQALGENGVQYRAEELSWLASMSQQVSVVVVWHTAGVGTLEDAKKKEVILGAAGSGGPMSLYPTLLNQTLGTRFKIVSGYEGGNQVNLAMERGEVQGRGTISWSSVQALKPDWIAEKKLVPLVQIGPEKEPNLPDVPLLIDLAQNDEQRQIFQFIALPSAMERPFAAPPQIPTARLNLLRRGFDAMVKTPEFIEAARKQDADLIPRSGEEVQKIVAAIVSTPPAVVERMKAAMAVREATR